MKYNEDKIVKEILDYIKSTYGQHYSAGQDGFQVQDLFKTLNIGKDFCQANAIKYLCRYGKKNGHNRADLLIKGQRIDFWPFWLYNELCFPI